jgi:hypothetical protein
MITFDIFLEQCNKNLFNKKDKSDVFYYLLKNRYKNPKLELKKFTNDECKDMKTFLKYDFSSYRKKRGDKFIPILEEVKFKEVILEMPDNGTVNWCLMPSGIIIDEIYGNKKEIKTHESFICATLQW